MINLNPFGMAGLERNAAWISLILAAMHPEAEYLSFGLEPHNEEIPYLVEIGEFSWGKMAKFHLVIESDRPNEQAALNSLYADLLGATKESNGFTCQNISYSDSAGSVFQGPDDRRQTSDQLYYGLRLRATLEMPFYRAVHWRNLVEEGLAPNTLCYLSRRGSRTEGIADSPLAYCIEEREW
ncbi:MAG: hypothetical protein ACRYFS_21985 [Janthinobacterium lividum]